jgi:hypothetical protein
MRFTRKKRNEMRLSCAHLSILIQLLDIALTTVAEGFHGEFSSPQSFQKPDLGLA